jgi:hypothetical protein
VKFRAIGDEFNGRFGRKDTAPLTRFEGFTSEGRHCPPGPPRHAQGRNPDVDTKSSTLSSDGAKHVDAAKAMGNFTNWTYAAVNAVASEVANIPSWTTASPSMIHSRVGNITSSLSRQSKRLLQSLPRRVNAFGLAAWR